MFNDKAVSSNRADEKIQRFINIQILKLKKVAAVGSLILLLLNFSFVAYPYLEYRGIHPYFIIPAIFFSLALFILFLAHIYLKWFDMYRTEAEAERYFNPYTVYAIGPFEEMQYRYLMLPMVEAVIHLQKDDDKKKEIVERVEQFRKWVNLGYIPKEDFPKHLKKFYITKKQNRL